MNRLKPFAIHGIAINNIGIFYPVAGSKFVFLFHKNLPGACSTWANLLFVPVGFKKGKGQLKTGIDD